MGFIALIAQGFLLVGIYLIEIDKFFFDVKDGIYHTICCCGGLHLISDIVYGKVTLLLRLHS